MAYPAVVSLKQTIHHLLNSSHISILSPTRQSLQDAHKQLTFIQQSLTRPIDINCGSKKRNKLNSLDSQIKESAHQLQDSLESHTSNLFLSIQHHISSPLKTDLKELHHEITSFTVTAKELEKSYIEELEKPNSAEDNSGEIVTNSAVKMVGLSDAIADMKDHLLRITRPDYFGVYVFFGGPGNGRSMVARGVYDAVCKGGDEHQLKQMFLDVIARIRGRHSFDCHYNKKPVCGAWVKIGAVYQLRQVLVDIIAQINCTPSFLENDGYSTDQKNLSSEVELGQHLAASLKGRRYVVALDDVQDTEILARLRRWLPEQNNGSIVLVTTGVAEVAEFDESFFRFEIPVVLNEAISWRCIKGLIESRGWVVTAAFEEAGKKIAENCGGYRIVVAKVMVALLRSEKSLNLWNKLAADKDDPIFKVDDELLEASEIKKRLHEDNVRECDFMFDVSTLINRIKSNLYPKRFFPPMGIMTIYGMAGLGKTTLIRNIFEDSSILDSFDRRVWVNIGQKYQSKEILVDVLHQIYPHIDKRLIKEDAKLVNDLCAQLSNKKCLIVLDDLWSQEPVHFLKMFIPNIKGELVVTTRMLKVGFFGPCDMAYKLRLLNKEESWDLLREKVFVEERCPSQLEKIGMKIAENCEGLPLLILAVAGFLSKSEKTLEHWNKVAEKNNPDVMNAQSEISKGLLPSYEALPSKLKVCFLYMGIFPRNHEIPTSTLMKLWFADGLLEPIFSQTTKDFAFNILKELDQSSMVMVKKGSDLESYKSCSLHSVYWHLSCNIARESKFFHVMDNYVDKSMKSLNGHRRLCIRKSILLGIKDVYDAVASASASRALLCTGPAHQYPVPLCFGSRLLKIIEALGIRLYEFPDDVVKQIHLRYIALTCDGNIPPSISNLWSLQFLIVRKYLSIKNSKSSSYLPNEIWDMKELKHLEVSGSKLPNPSCKALLPNLSSLLDVSVHNCEKEILKRIPGVKKLGIQIELEPDDESIPFHNLNFIADLDKLESLKCVVVNPELGPDFISLPAPCSMFPLSLKKLCLSGLGYPWKYMNIIGSLPNLNVLKLQCHAFQGPFWEIGYTEFPKLKFLLIEDTDLVHWDIIFPSVYFLQHISIRHCYNLEQLPSSLIDNVQVLEVIDSHPLAVKWAKKMKEENWEIRKMKSLELRIHCSWDDEK